MGKLLKGYVPTSIGQVHYRCCGERRPTRLPVVLVHQTPSSSVMFERLMRALDDGGGAAGHRWLVALDLPGFGESAPLSEVSVEAMALALGEALARLEIDRCVLFGHHAGASVCAALARREPELAEAVVVSGPPTVAREALEVRVGAIEPIDERGAHVAATWARVVAKDAAAPSWLRTRETALALVHLPTYEATYRAILAHDMCADLGALECPVLVMAGPDDPLRAGVEAAAAACADGEARILAEGGTFVCDTAPALVARALGEFFEKRGI